MGLILGNRIAIGVQVASKLLSSSEYVTADSSRIITVDGESKTIKEWFDEINTEFTLWYLTLQLN